MSQLLNLVLPDLQVIKTVKKPVEYGSNEYKSENLNDFFNTNLGDGIIYTLSFWDRGYTYEIGQAPTGDWLGVRSILEFEYNP